MGIRSADRTWQTRARDRAFDGERIRARPARLMWLEVFWFDRFPEMVRFFHRHPGATVIPHLASARVVEMRKRYREPGILHLVDKDVQQDRRRGIAQLDVRISNHDQVLRQIESQLVVGASKLGMNDAGAKHMRARSELTADNDPAFNRRDEQGAGGVRQGPGAF